MVGNPPYNANGCKNSGNVIWNLFVKKILKSLLSPQGYLLFIHPSMWRKPETERSKNKGMFKMMVQDRQLLYLDINDKKAGRKTFNCDTCYDWYLLENKPRYTTTIIKSNDQQIHHIDTALWHWLPNHSYDLVLPLLTQEEQNIIINCRSTYGMDKSWTQETKDEVYCYPLIHTTPMKGVRYYYSSKIIPNCGMFGVSKIIFGDGGIKTPVVDFEGKYGMTNHSMALPISSEEEGQEIALALTSPQFKVILNACLWSNFRVDWCLFNWLKPEFWKMVS